MNVAGLMNRSVETCRSSDTLAAAARLMWERDVGCLPVVSDDGSVIAMVTDRDICMAACIQGRPLAEIPVSVAMSRDLHTCRADEGIIEAEEIMRQRQVRRLPVLDATGQLEGIISLNDIAREAEREVGRKGREVSPQEVAVTLAAVCAPRGVRELTLS
jgi:CBS domain-containing protein